MGLETFKAEMTGVDGGGFERGEGAIDSVQVKGGNIALKAFGSDAVDGARARGVEIGVSTDTRVEPVAEVERAVRSHRDVGGAEEEFLFFGGVGAFGDFFAHDGGATSEVGAVEGFSGVAGKKVVAIEGEGRTFGLGLVGEDDISGRFAAEEGTDVFFS